MFVKEIYLTVTVFKSGCKLYAVTEADTKPRSVSFAEPVINQFLLNESWDSVHVNFTFISISHPSQR